MTGEVSFQNLPGQIATALGFDPTTTYGSLVGSVFATMILMLLFVSPVLFLSAKFKRDALLPSLMMGFLSLILGVTAFALPYWILLIVAMIVGLLFAGSMREWLTGRGG